jgi:hypothetical protein
MLKQKVQHRINMFRTSSYSRKKHVYKKKTNLKIFQYKMILKKGQTYLLIYFFD